MNTASSATASPLRFGRRHGSLKLRILFVAYMWLVNRRMPDGYPAEGWVPGQKVSITEALKSYTQEGCLSSFEEHIKEKFWLAVLLISLCSHRIFLSFLLWRGAKTKVLLTVSDGKVVYREASMNKYLFDLYIVHRNETA